MTLSKLIAAAKATEKTIHFGPNEDMQRLERHLQAKASALNEIVEAAEEVIHAPDNTTTAFRKLKLKEALSKYKGEGK